MPAVISMWFGTSPIGLLLAEGLHVGRWTCLGLVSLIVNSRHHLTRPLLPDPSAVGAGPRPMSGVCHRSDTTAAISMIGM